MEKALVHLVDDDAAVRGTLARLLVSGGYRVREYESGLDLVAASATLRSGCVLLDIDMPGADGFQIHQLLRDRSVDLPVILMTGGGDLTLLALKAGASDFIQKPFGRGELLSLIEQIVAGPCLASTH